MATGFFEEPPGGLPDDEVDLADIVTHLHRSRAESRRRLARAPMTRHFLDAALDLTRNLLDGEEAKDLDDEGTNRPTLSYLSRAKVAQHARKLFAADATEEKLRSRWATHSDFLADFISYALRGRHWSLHVARNADTEGLLLAGVDFPTAVHEVALRDLLAVMAAPEQRFQLLATASAQVDPAVAEALVDMYRTLLGAWGALYEKVFARYGVTFRPGLTMDMFNICLQASAEGLALRIISGTNEDIYDEKERTSLLGTTAIALFLAFVDPGDGLTLEQTMAAAMDHLQGSREK